MVVGFQKFALFVKALILQNVKQHSNYMDLILYSTSVELCFIVDRHVKFGMVIEHKPTNSV
jgi:hypothetical protein